MTDVAVERRRPRRDVEVEQPVDVIVLTEQYTRRQVRRLRRVLRPWFTVTRQGEYVWLCRRTTMTPRGPGRIRRATRVYSLREAWRDLWLGRLLIEHDASGALLLWLAAHLASNVEDNRGPEVQANKQGLKVIGRVIARAERAHPDWIPVWSADTNRALELAEQLHLVQSSTDTITMWAGVDDPPGTHGGIRGRTIDTVGVARGRGRFEDSDVTQQRQPVDDDHRGVVTTLLIVVNGRTYRIRVAHLSGRYDADVDAFVAYVAAVAGVTTNRGRAA